MSDELLVQLLAGTGPLGTVLVGAAMWLRGELRAIRHVLKTHERRIRKVEGAPPPLDDSDPAAPITVT